jgi:ABC-type amino acid transport substrate-binding protein
MPDRLPLRPVPALLPALAFPIALALAACDARTSGEGRTGVDGTVTETFSEQAPEPVTRATFEEARAVGEARITYFFVPSSGFAYRDGAGGLTGVTAELLRDFAHFVAREHGIDVQVEWVEEERWAAFYGYVRSSTGGAFGIGNVTVTEARSEELDFSPPYLNNVAVLVTHENIPELRSMDEIGQTFRGLTALPYPGTLHETRLDAIRERHLPDAPTHPVASNEELVALLSGGDEHFGYMDVYNYWRARETGAPLRHHPVGDDDSETFGVIMPHGSDWTPVMEHFFRRDGGYVESARFRESMRRHLGDALASLLTQE